MNISYIEATQFVLLCHRCLNVSILAFKTTWFPWLVPPPSSVTPPVCASCHIFPSLCPTSFSLLRTLEITVGLPRQSKMFPHVKIHIQCCQRVFLLWTFQTVEALDTQDVNHLPGHDLLNSGSHPHFFPSLWYSSSFLGKAEEMESHLN